jgi:hypothetical protein
MKTWKIFLCLIYLSFVISCSLNTGVEITQKTNVPQTDYTQQNIQLSVSTTTSGIQIVLAWVQAADDAGGYTVSVYSGQNRKYVSSLTTNKSMIVIENINDGVYYYEVLTGDGKYIGICGPITIQEGKIIAEDAKVEVKPEVEIKIEFDRETFEREKSLWEALGISNYEFTFYSYSPWGYPTLIRVLDNKQEIIQGHAYPVHPGTITDFYKWIEDTVTKHKQEALSRGEGWLITVTVDYNSKYHYPEYCFISINPHPGKPIIGGWQDMAITSFKILD